MSCKSEIKIEGPVSKQKSKKQISAKKKDDLTVAIAKRILNRKVAVNAKSNLKDIAKHLHNARTIILNSNATPIRSYNGKGYVCCFCPETFPAFHDLKAHTLEGHNKREKAQFMQGCSLSKYIAKLDVTDLKCDICDQSMDNLQTLVSHLQSDHDKTYYADINDHIVPMKRDGDEFICVICSKTFERFKVMVGHMNLHYRNHICKSCDSAFVNRVSLRVHSQTHKQGEFTCSYCSKIFDTKAKMSYHEKFVHIKDHRRNICPYCNKKFLCYFKKTEHMVQEHGVESLVLKCKACDKTFARKSQLNYHIKRDHLLERKYECQYCDMKFFEKKKLGYHLVKHTGIKPYQCDFCSKEFVKRESLKEHLSRVHSEESKFVCVHCGLVFVQENSWKRHMRSEHAAVL